MVFAINPLSAAWYRQRHPTSGAQSHATDAHLLAESVGERSRASPPLSCR
jgi:hypothetical protein